MRREEYLLVDGYNIIFSWDDLREIAEYSLELARDRLINILENYQGYKNTEIIIVFDAHKVSGSAGSVIKRDKLTVIYTGEAETADHYIEHVSRSMAKIFDVTVATSDNLEQIIIIGSGAKRLSAKDLLLAVKETEKAVQKRLADIKPIKNNQLIDNLSDDMLQKFEEIRRKGSK